MEVEDQQYNDEDYDYEYDSENEDYSCKVEEASEEPTLEFDYELKVSDMPSHLRSIVFSPKVDISCDRIYVVLRFTKGIVRYSMKRSDSKRLGPLIGIFEQALKNEETDCIDVNMVMNERSRNQMCDIMVQKLYAYILFCPVCCERHTITPESLIPCEQSRCLEKFITDKLGADIKNVIINSPQYVDLIVSITYWALDDERFAERRDENFTPFPQQLINKGKRSYAQVKRDLDELPSVDILCDMVDSGTFDEYFNDHLELKEIFYVLEWILFSNRTALRYIDSCDLTPQEVGFAGQVCGGKLFRIVNPPDVEAAFQHHRGDKKTEWVYHGSDSKCWHGILRNGLQVMSNTKYMTAGAAYGAGIYFATEITTSLNYCRPSAVRWPQQKHLVSKCMMIGEFIPHNNTDASGKVFPTVPTNFRIAREKKYYIPRYLLCS